MRLAQLNNFAVSTNEGKYSDIHKWYWLSTCFWFRGTWRNKGKLNAIVEYLFELKLCVHFYSKNTQIYEYFVVFWVQNFARQGRYCWTVLVIKMILSQLIKSLLIILRLDEFLKPDNLSFIVQDDALDSIDSQFAEVLSTKGSKILTCSKYVIWKTTHNWPITVEFFNKCLAMWLG